MPPRKTSAESRRALDRLAALRHDEVRRQAVAVELLREFDDPLVLHQALAALGDTPPAAAREPLVRLLRLFSAAPGRDPGGLLRAEILGHLDEHLTAAELPLLESAVVTVERTPNDRAGAAVLRAAALIALDRVEPELAIAHAAVMLANTNDPASTSEMTGEPAATAARVLAARDQWATLLLFVASADFATLPEPLAEAVRGLAGAPAPVLIPVMEKLNADARELVELGVGDLVVAHPGGPALLAWFGRFLRTVSSADVYRYLLTAVIASRRHDLFEVVAASLTGEYDRARLVAAAEALPLAVHEPAARELLSTIERRIKPT